MPVGNRPWGGNEGRGDQWFLKAYMYSLSQPWPWILPDGRSLRILLGRRAAQRSAAPWRRKSTPHPHPQRLPYLPHPQPTLPTSLIPSHPIPSHLSFFPPKRPPIANRKYEQSTQSANKGKQKAPKKGPRIPAEPPLPHLHPYLHACMHACMQARTAHRPHCAFRG
ncbi:hypothetical protein BS50DRAFT_72213 [Corynespora cassiicola Philippines]|uniref:Uncharacterized protein n=1 Tax=Corynespora cassiicola Philippines TaxID=1448308 RepID=A0A2T2NG07_CORCC|nr:hypothetical protein BS50DRAFT_72213 [Corynespora cassiicola Philippines]